MTRSLSVRAPGKRDLTSLQSMIKHASRLDFRTWFNELNVVKHWRFVEVPSLKSGFLHGCHIRYWDAKSALLENIFKLRLRQEVLIFTLSE